MMIHTTATHTNVNLSQRKILPDIVFVCVGKYDVNAPPSLRWTWEIHSGTYPLIPCEGGITIALPIEKRANTMPSGGHDYCLNGRPIITSR